MTEQELWELHIQQLNERFMQSWEQLQGAIAAYNAKSFVATPGSDPDGIIWSAQHVQKFMVNDPADLPSTGAHLHNFAKGRYIP